jgi:hypothetical protein
MKLLDISGYPGEWVAVQENKVIAHSKTLEQLMKETKGMKVAFAKVPKTDFQFTHYAHHVSIH